MFNTKEEFLQRYVELLIRCTLDTENQLNSYNELMYLTSSGYLKLGDKAMDGIKEQMEEIRERIFKETPL